MSLLMDALRKAEEAKRQAGEGAAPELTLAPLTTAASPLPELSEHLAAVDAELSAAASDTRAAPRSPAATARDEYSQDRRATERASARNAFAAKAPPKSRRTLWLTLALCGVAAIGFGAYFWWQLQSMAGASRPLLAQAPAPTSATPAAAPPPATATASTALPALPASTPPPSLATAPAIAPTPAPETALFTPRTRASKPAPSARQDSPGALRLSTSAAPSPLEKAYDALQAGRIDEAQGAYEQVLRSDGKNTDALLGLATIAARQGQTELAQGYYRRALESDPNDPTAQAGLINTRGQADPGASESRLKSALAGQPEAVALHFALGNLYARQARWSEAQQAYFRAYSGEPDNADFIFNLAVSLDHLHQSRLAAQYYQMALGSAQSQTASFDKNQVKKRIAELQP